MNHIKEPFIFFKSGDKLTNNEIDNMHEKPAVAYPKDADNEYVREEQDCFAVSLGMVIIDGILSS
jgi:hypothetical protein